MKVLHFYFRLSGDQKENSRAIQDLIRAIRKPSLPDVQIGPLLSAPPSPQIKGITFRGASESVALASDRLRQVLRREEVDFKEEESDEPAPPPTPPDREPQPVEGFNNVVRQGVYGFAQFAPEATAAEKAHWRQQQSLQSGIRFFHLGLHEDAERQLKHVVRGKTGPSEAFHYLGLVYEQLGRLEDAARALRRSIEIDGDGAASYFYLANIEQKQGHLDNAINSYKKAIERDPEVPVIYNNLGWVYYQKGEHERALKAFEEAISIEPELPFAHNGLACVYQDMGHLAEAVEEFKQAIEYFPGYAAAHLKLGWTYLLMGDIPSAITSLKTAVQSADDPQYSVSAEYSLGHAYMSQNQVQQAYDAFEHVMKEDPEFTEASFHAAEALVRLGRYDEAIPRLLEYAEKSTENRQDTYKLLATSYFHLNRYKDASAAARSALRLDPTDTELQELLGNIATVRGRWKEAEKIFFKVLQLNPTSAFTHFQLGWIYENTDRVNQAIEEYKKSIQFDPEATEAYNNLGWLYTEQGKRKEALVIFEKAIELNPRDVDLINNLGWTYSILGKHTEALEQYQKGLSMNPQSSLLHANLGTIYYKMGRFPESKRALERALDLRGDASDHAVAHYYLGLMAKRDNQVPQALHHFQEAVRLDPEYPEPYFPLGECLAAQGRPQKAATALKSYLKLSPNGEFVEQAKEMLSRSKEPKAGSKRDRG